MITVEMRHLGIRLLSEKYLQTATIITDKDFVEVIFSHDLWHIFGRTDFLE